MIGIGIGVGLGGGGGGRLAAIERPVEAGATGAVTTLARQLAGSSWKAISGTTSLDTGGVISRSAGLADGASVTIVVREETGPLAVEYPVTLTGRASIAPSPSVVITGTPPDQVVGQPYDFTYTKTGSGPWPPLSAAAKAHYDARSINYSQFETSGRVFSSGVTA